jgi:hypothetical protein
VLTEPAPAVQAFFDSYRTAFERSDARAIAGHFAYPCQLTSDADEIVLASVASQEQWIGMIEQLVGSYRRIGVSSARIVEFAATQLSPRLHHAVVRWLLHDGDGNVLYGFDAAYTLAEIGDELRITALAHNELPQLRTYLASLP